MFTDILDEMTKANTLPEYNDNIFNSINLRGETLLSHIQPRENPDIFQYIVAIMFFLFLYPLLEKWFWSFAEMLGKLANYPVRRGESIYRDNPMRLEAVWVFIRYDEHLLYYSLSAGFYYKMRTKRGNPYDRFYRRLRFHSKQRRITFSEDYS